VQGCRSADAEGALEAGHQIQATKAQRSNPRKTKAKTGIVMNSMFIYGSGVSSFWCVA
jgi:hypothetical protein